MTSGFAKPVRHLAVNAAGYIHLATRTRGQWRVCVLTLVAVAALYAALANFFIAVFSASVFKN